MEEDFDEGNDMGEEEEEEEVNNSKPTISNTSITTPFLPPATPSTSTIGLNFGGPRTAPLTPFTSIPSVPSFVPGTPNSTTPIPFTPSLSAPLVHHILQNIVSTVNLGCKLDLKKIALGARNAEYNPRRFSAVIMRIREPKTTALLFASGKMVCTGAKSVDDAKLASKKYARIVQKLGFPAKFTEFKVQNMVASADMKFPIRLEGLSYSQPHYSSYEPELFPGLIYRMIKPKVVLLIFVSGKVVLTGAKDEQQITEAFNNILPVLHQHKKLSLSSTPSQIQH